MMTKSNKIRPSSPEDDEIVTDRGWSWVVALSCCFINMMTLGMYRVSGQLFVATLETFPVSRQSASFPYTLSAAIGNFLGPLVGYLGNKFGVKSVSISGALMCSFGIGMCFFATNIIWIILPWGIFFGFGYALASHLMPVCINENFVKHRGMASGISFCGSSVGSFILPPIIDILMEKYGLQGTFLIISGLVLHCIPAAMLLRIPRNTRDNNSTIRGRKNLSEIKTVSSSVPSIQCSCYDAHRNNSLMGNNVGNKCSFNYREAIQQDDFIDNRSNQDSDNHHQRMTIAAIDKEDIKNRDRLNSRNIGHVLNASSTEQIKIKHEDTNILCTINNPECGTGKRSDDFHNKTANYIVEITDKSIRSYFRENIGSYEGVFYAVGTMCLVGFLTWSYMSIHDRRKCKKIEIKLKAVSENTNKSKSTETFTATSL